MQWYILDRDGNPMNVTELPPRPDDARPVNAGGAFTPWYKPDEHLHVEGDRIAGIHAAGESLEGVQAKLTRYLAQEARVIEICGSDKDILLSEADLALG